MPYGDLLDASQTVYSDGGIMMCGVYDPGVPLPEHREETRVFEVSGVRAADVYTPVNGCTLHPGDVYDLGFELAAANYVERADAELE